MFFIKGGSVLLANDGLCVVNDLNALKNGQLVELENGRSEVNEHVLLVLKQTFMSVLRVSIYSIRSGANELCKY